MWTREALKSRAKAVLKTNYWKAFLISLVVLFSGGSGSGGSSAGSSGSNSGWSGNNDSVRYAINDITNYTLDHRSVLIIAMGVLILAIAFRILLGYALEVGSRKYFVKSAEYKDNSKCISFAFDRQNYNNLILTMLLTGIYNLLWFLLFIVPGIIKFYAYRMVPYILTDNPNIGAKRAIELSIEMTNGHKLDMFVLDLSFLGWYFLGALALGIGTLFVNPYAFATEAELYLVLRNNAIENYYCSHDELLIDI